MPGLAFSHYHVLLIWDGDVLQGVAELLMDDNATAEAPRPGISLSRPMTKAGGLDQSTRPMTRYYVCRLRQTFTKVARSGYVRIVCHDTTYCRKFGSDKPVAPGIPWPSVPFVVFFVRITTVIRLNATGTTAPAPRIFTPMSFIFHLS